MAKGVLGFSLLYVSHFTPQKNPLNSALLLSQFLGDMSKVT